MALAKQSKAPDFTLPSSSGEDFTLSENLKGQPCILYFYPKDFTPGCTKEACSFRDNFSAFRNTNITVVGISKDSVATHQKFKKEHNLPFELLSDESGKVCKAYQALVPFIKLPKRITYLLDADHKIVSSYESMFDAPGHINKMLAEAEKLAQ